MPDPTNATGNAAVPTIFAVLLLSGLTTQPDIDQLRQRPAVVTAYQNQDPSHFSATEKTWILEHCGEGGLPVRTTTLAAEPYRIITRKTYVLAHSSHLKIPLWVCEHIDKNELDGPDKNRLHPEPFTADPELEGWPRAEKNDYQKSNFGKLGLATGHMMPDADRTLNALKRETYFLSNMVPQVGGRFNSSKWQQLEKRVRKWALTKPLLVITGGFVHDPKEDDVGTADGVVSYYVVGQNQVAVPTHVYKIIVAPPAATGGVWESLAILMENRPYLKQADAQAAGLTGEIDYTAFLTSIDELERLTGFDFFPELDGVFEASVATTLWD